MCVCVHACVRVCAVLGVTRYVILLLLWYLSNIMKYAIKTGNITQVTLLTNVMRYLSNIVTVTSLILHKAYSPASYL